MTNIYKRGGNQMQSRKWFRGSSSVTKFTNVIRGASAALVVIGVSGVASLTAGASGTSQSQQFVVAHTKLPTSIFVTTPLNKKPPKGLTVDYLNGENPDAAAIGVAMQQAAGKLGWKVVSIDAGQTPESVVAAMNIAVENHPSAVVGAGFPASTYPNQLKTLKADHIPYVTTGTTDCQTTCDYAATGVMADVASPVDYVTRGQYEANWIAGNSNGKADVVTFDFSTYAVLDTLAKSFNSSLKTVCAGCRNDNVDITVASIGTTLPAQVVSYLQAHPSVNYVFMTNGVLTTGLQNALNSAGLANKVKIVDQAGGTANLENIASGGSEKVDLPESNPVLAWTTLDAVARSATNTPINEEQYDRLPTSFVTKANVGNPKTPYVGVTNYQQQFLKLWKLGS
jgi:ribose transport system substrate-binding protein